MLYCPSCFKLWSDTTDVAACDCGKPIDKMEATPEMHPVQCRGVRGGRSGQYCHGRIRSLLQALRPSASVGDGELPRRTWNWRACRIPVCKSLPEGRVATTSGRGV